MLVGGENCITTCQGMADGDYQSCQGCMYYATCSNGILYDERPCPSDLVWDDNLKRCEWTSDTCGGCGDCVTSCTGLPDGFYQSCDSCSDYITCSSSATYSKPCPEGLLWNDEAKQCASTSNTCPKVGCGEQAPKVDTCNCIDSCDGMPDGDYQSCQGCYVYATCSNGILYDNRECPSGLVWDDNVKRCEWTSDTCGSDCQPDSPPSTCECVDDCDGTANGDHQSCHGCNVYITCLDGKNYDDRNCPAGLVWDDFDKRCSYESSTCGDECGGAAPDPCQCVSSCDGLADGTYQSCQACSLYVTCSNGALTDNQCPTGLVWDANDKSCVPVSGTCAPQCESAQRPCNCITSCADLPNGDYQSCQGCDVYATCSDNVLEDGRPCPDGTSFDNHMKACIAVSQTCDEKCIGGETPPPGDGSNEESNEGSNEIPPPDESNGDGSSEENNDNGSSSNSKDSGSQSKSKESGGTSKSKGSGSKESGSKSKGSGSKESGSKSKGSGSKSKSKGSGSKSKGSGSKESGSKSNGKGSGSKENGGGSNKGSGGKPKARRMTRLTNRRPTNVNQRVYRP